MNGSFMTPAIFNVSENLVPVPNIAYNNVKHYSSIFCVAKPFLTWAIMALYNLLFLEDLSNPTITMHTPQYQKENEKAKA